MDRPPNDIKKVEIKQIPSKFKLVLLNCKQPVVTSTKPQNILLDISELIPINSINWKIGSKIFI